MSSSLPRRIGGKFSRRAPAATFASCCSVLPIRTTFAPAVCGAEQDGWQPTADALALELQALFPTAEAVDWASLADDQLNATFAEHRFAYRFFREAHPADEVCDAVPGP